MYANQFAVAIQQECRTLVEFGDQVYIPHGSEFSIFMKNLSTRRVSVKVLINGHDMLNGNALLINSNSKLNLERPFNNNPFDNKFRFVHGFALIGIEYQFEQIQPRMGWTQKQYTQQSVSPVSYQQFNRVSPPVLETQKYFMSLRLVSQSPVDQSFFTRTSIFCTSCGTKCKSSNNFCPKCGNSLKAYK